MINSVVRPAGVNQGGAFRKLVVANSVSRESEHNWRFKSMVFTVYIFVDFALVQARRSFFLIISLSITRYAHFQLIILECI